MEDREGQEEAMTKAEIKELMDLLEAYRKHITHYSPTYTWPVVGCIEIVKAFITKKRKE